MKNSTLIRIKVPKALYESALKKALLEATDKATPEKVKASIQKQEKEHNDKTNKMIAKARAAKAKTGVKEARHISDFITLKPGREISKDTQHLGEKKKQMEEASLMDKVDPKKVAEEKKKKAAEDKKKKEADAKKAADKKKAEAAKKK
jgi:colicin import membrane protein